MKPWILTFVLFFASCSHKEHTVPPSPPRVQIAKAETATIPIMIDAIGHCVAYNSAEIKAQVEGRLLEIHFNNGDMVKEGQLLFTIDPRPYEADLEEAVATLEESKAQLVYASQQLSMYSGLISEQYVSPLDFLKYQTENANYEAMVMKNTAGLKKAELNLNYCFITAPFTGITSKRFLDIGNLIVNNGKALITIKQIDPILVDFSIPERDFCRFMRYQKNGSRDMFVIIPDELDCPHKGKITLIENEIDQKTGMIPLRGELPNDSNTFWPGQFVRIQILLKEEKNAVLIPEEAVNIGQKGQYALIVRKDNTAEYRSIETGTTMHHKVHIIQGIQAGEKVITVGQFNVVPDRPVEVIKNK